MAELDEDLLVLDAEQVGLGDLRNAQESQPRLLDHRLDLCIGEAVRLEGPDQAVGVAVLVVEVRPDHALRQACADVADLLAHLVPKVGHLGGRNVVAQRDIDHRLAGLGVALDVVEVGQLLQLGLELVGDLLLHLARGGARPGGRDDHLLDGEGWVLAAAEVEIGEDAGRRQHQHEEQRQRAVLERERREVGAARAHGRAPTCSGLTFCPCSSLCTPAVATISPSCTPEAIKAVSSRQRETTTGRSVTAPDAGSITQTAGSLPCWKIDVSGTSASFSGSGRARTSDAVMPMPMKSGASTTVKRAG